MKHWLFFWVLTLVLCRPVRAQEKDWFTFVEVNAEFTKGDLNTFLQKQMDYPEDAKERKIQGKVFVSFVVDTVGKVSEIKVVKGLGYGCDEEAQNAIAATSGFWIPARNKEKKVKVKMVLPVEFSLSPLRSM